MSINILDRYIISQFMGPFLLAVGAFVIIGIVDILFVLVDSFINSGVSLFIVIRLLIYKIPAIMVLFFPMAVLFSVMLLLIRMAKDNEITIIRA
ncbi:MAG: LptF/LptG family permease, partial [Candidatus Margulisbacteria bacterium]|nr:LptF/LptG family permease [Candidatus Margulisiibacteriota bacterium]